MSVRAPAAAPCGSCPYRRDVASGVWDADEYEKLPPYDRPTGEQPPAAFLCHQQDGRLCAGWAGCHDMDESLALRMLVASDLIADDGSRRDPRLRDRCLALRVGQGGARPRPRRGRGAVRVRRPHDPAPGAEAVARAVSVSSLGRGIPAARRRTDDLGMTRNLSTAEAAWDSESRLSPFATVWSPEQDDEAEWQGFYDAAKAMGYMDAAATAYADDAAA